MRICVFEDDGFVNLFPLVHLRPVYELRLGTRSLLDKHLKLFEDASLSLLCRSHIKDDLSARYPDAEVGLLGGDSYLFLNGRAILNEATAEFLSGAADKLFLNDGKIAAAKISGTDLEPLRKAADAPLTRDDFPDLPSEELDCRWMTYPWDLVSLNPSELKREYIHHGIEGDVADSAQLIEPARITVERGARIMPGVVLDASEGPVTIRESAVVMPHSFLQGPVYVGRGSSVKVGSKIYEGTTIGKVCKIGGEVEESIFHSYSNKQHDGFIGHSYISKWVNFGAGTSNSDLKNNYGNVRVHVDGEMIDTGSTFVGLFAGDHSKTAINTTFNTGTHLGICCNVFGAGFPPKFIPSFSWGGGADFDEYRCDKAVETACVVMSRRKIELEPTGVELIKHVFDSTAPERDKFLGRH